MPQADVDRLRMALLRLARRIRVNAEGALTPSQHTLMISVLKYEPCTVSELAEHEHVKPPSASKIVAALEERGLVARSNDPLDRRRSVITSTEAGHAYLEHFRASTRTWLASQLANLDTAEIDAIGAALPALERLVGSGG